MANSTCYLDVAEVYYGYTRGNLTTVSRHDLSGRPPWQGYAMTTDAWGNLTKIQVQGATASDTVPVS